MMQGHVKVEYVKENRRKQSENINMNQENEADDAREKKRNRARAERRRRAHKRLMAAEEEAHSKCNTEVEPKSGSMQ